MTNLQKVQAIVAKARSTEFDGERAVFLAKAEQLIQKYGLDRSATGIDGDPVRTDVRWGEPFGFGSGFDEAARRAFRDAQERRRREQRRGPGNRYTSEMLYKAAMMRREGRSFKAIGEHFGIKATGHLAKTLKENGYL